MPIRQFCYNLNNNTEGSLELQSCCHCRLFQYLKHEFPMLLSIPDFMNFNNTWQASDAVSLFRDSADHHLFNLIGVRTLFDWPLPRASINLTLQCCNGIRSETGIDLSYPHPARSPPPKTTKKTNKQKKTCKLKKENNCLAMCVLVGAWH